MENKRGNTTLIIIAGILIILVIMLIIIYSSLGGDDSSKKVTNTSSTTNTSNTSTSVNTSTVNKQEETKTDTKVNTKTTVETETKTDANKDTKTETKTETKTDTKTTEKETTKVEEDNTPEVVKKIDESQGKIYDKTETIGGWSQKVPIINLTTKAVTKLNSDVEAKYKDGPSNGYYIVYYYYMYIGMVSLILDYRYTNGTHKYEVYNVNSETGKMMSNEDLCTKLKVSKNDFLTRAKSAYKAKFEELFKNVDKNSSPYKTALEATLKNADNALSDPMFINLEAQFAVYAKIVNVSNGSEEYHLVEFK